MAEESKQVESKELSPREKQVAELEEFFTALQPKDEGSQESEEGEEESDPPAKPEEKKDAKIPEEDAELKKNKEEAHKKAESEFKFDKKKYEDKGITSKEALKELERLEKQTFEGQKLIGKHSNTIGSQKQELKELEETMKLITARKKELEPLKDLNDAEYDELAIESPSKAAKMKHNADKANEEYEQLAIKETEYRNKGIVKQYFENFDSLIDKIVEVVKEDSPDIDSKSIRQFRDNPYLMDGTLLLNLGKRAQIKLEKEALSSEIQLLKKTMSEMEQRLNDAPGKTLKRIKDLSNIAQTGVSVSQGHSSKGATSFSPYDIMNADPKKLREYLKQTNSGG